MNDLSNATNAKITQVLGLKFVRSIKWHKRLTAFCSQATVKAQPLRPQTTYSNKTAYYIFCGCNMQNTM